MWCSVLLKEKTSSSKFSGGIRQWILKPSPTSRWICCLLFVCLCVSQGMLLTQPAVSDVEWRQLSQAFKTKAEVMWMIACVLTAPVQQRSTGTQNKNWVGLNVRTILILYILMLWQLWPQGAKWMMVTIWLLIKAVFLGLTSKPHIWKSKQIMKC